MRNVVLPKQVVEAVNILSTEQKKRSKEICDDCKEDGFSWCDCYRFDYGYDNIKPKLKKYGFTTKKEGAFRVCFLSPKWVLKVYKDLEDEDNVDLKEESKFINKMRKTKFARHFPQTYYIKGVLIQERVDVSVKLFNKFWSECDNLGEFLGVDDIHEYNIGWRSKNRKPVPVFIDCNIIYENYLPTKKKKKRSWFVM